MMYTTFVTSNARRNYCLLVLSILGLVNRLDSWSSPFHSHNAGPVGCTRLEMKTFAGITLGTVSRYRTRAKCSSGNPGGSGRLPQTLTLKGTLPVSGMSIPCCTDDPDPTKGQGCYRQMVKYAPVYFQSQISEL